MMLTEASLLTVKVAGAEGVILYDLKMEAAMLIRKAAIDLMIQNHAMIMFGFKESSILTLSETSLKNTGCCSSNG